MRKGMIGLIVIVGLALVSNVASASEKKKGEHPDATVRFETGSVAVGVGFSWGSGTLTFHGKKYPFSVNGLSVGAVGVSRATASGSVFHLSKLEDFNGNYTAASAGATVAGGGSVAAMQNQQGVVIRMASTTRGLKVQLAVDGVKIALKQ